MYTQYYLKNNYIESSRNFSDDYANIDSRKIDMTLSGKYLYKYPNFDIDFKQLCLYPSKYDALDLIKIIRKKVLIFNITTPFDYFQKNYSIYFHLQLYDQLILFLEYDLF